MVDTSGPPAHQEAHRDNRLASIPTYPLLEPPCALHTPPSVSHHTYASSQPTLIPKEMQTHPALHSVLY